MYIIIYVLEVWYTFFYSLCSEQSDDGVQQPAVRDGALARVPVRRDRGPRDIRRQPDRLREPMHQPGGRVPVPLLLIRPRRLSVPPEPRDSSHEPGGLRGGREQRLYGEPVPVR